MGGASRKHFRHGSISISQSNQLSIATEGGKGGSIHGHLFSASSRWDKGGAAPLEDVALLLAENESARADFKEFFMAYGCGERWTHVTMAHPQ